MIRRGGSGGARVGNLRGLGGFEGPLPPARWQGDERRVERFACTKTYQSLPQNAARLVGVAREEQKVDRLMALP